MRIDEKVLANYNKIESFRKNDDNKSNISEKRKNSKALKYDVSIITERIKKLPDVRQDKIDQLRNQIESGTYNVSGRKVAEKIVGAALDNLF